MISEENKKWLIYNDYIFTSKSCNVHINNALKVHLRLDTIKKSIKTQPPILKIFQYLITFA